MTDAELCLKAAQACEFWKTAHELYPTWTLDATFSDAEIRGNSCVLVPNNPMRQDPQEFNPLHNDEQAMALVKKLRLDIEPMDERWMVVWKDNNNGREHKVTAESLNLAIVECAATLSHPPNRKSP